MMILAAVGVWIWTNVNAALVRVGAANEHGIPDSLGWSDAFHVRDLSRFERSEVYIKKNFTDAEARWILSLRNVEMVVLANATLSNDTFERLAKLRDIEMLRIIEPTKLGRPQMEHVSELLSLRWLVITTPISDDDLRPLGRLQALRGLTILEADIQGHGLRQLRNLKNLDFINITSTKLELEPLQVAIPFLPKTNHPTWIKRRGRQGSLDYGAYDFKFDEQRQETQLAHMQKQAHVYQVDYDHASGTMKVLADRILDYSGAVHGGYE